MRRSKASTRASRSSRRSFDPEHVGSAERSWAGALRVSGTDPIGHRHGHHGHHHHGRHRPHRRVTFHDRTGRDTRCTRPLSRCFAIVSLRFQQAVAAAAVRPMAREADAALAAGTLAADRVVIIATRRPAEQRTGNQEACRDNRHVREFRNAHGTNSSERRGPKVLMCLVGTRRRGYRSMKAREWR